MKVSRINYFLEGLLRVLPALWNPKLYVLIITKYPTEEKKLKSEKDWKEAIKIVTKNEKKS